MNGFFHLIFYPSHLNISFKKLRFPFLVTTVYLPTLLWNKKSMYVFAQFD